MPRLDLFRTTAFRWAMAFAAAFTGLSIVLFAFVYWQTAHYERAQMDTMLRHEATLIANDPAGANGALRTWLRDDAHNVRYGILVGHDGVPQAGNMPSVPKDLWPDTQPQSVTTEAHDPDGDQRAERIRALGLKLADGRTLALGSDTDAVEHVSVVILRALGLGLGPMVALSLLGGAVLGRRALGRVTILSHAISEIREGRLSGRLPITGRRDEFDRLAVDINAMMDEIERLLEEVRSVGDSIAHDLRTPLTRARTRLERSRNAVTTPAEFAAAIDEALGWLDQTFAVITAVLRIGEIEHGRRRAAFQPVDLGQILVEAAELYDPVAEEREITVRVDVEPASGATAMGDRDLLFEAVANLLDNAIKFTPRHGHVLLSLVERDGSLVVTVADDGPGIAEADRKRVLERFYRAERSRQREGVGLGLSLVAAIATLHGFGLTIGDHHPGCRVELTCRDLTDSLSLAGEHSDTASKIEAVDAARDVSAFRSSSSPQQMFRASAGGAVASKTSGKRAGLNS
ncbi:HAMP domain-containing sensor histidine kinase [Lichenifustis flavocetrariae]|uniref:histidine kinase n=1 Tax=Lichenifustis flavocetrariae TaxID=2949735 RepID=A0AA42CRY1_9HYPH|nr:ATP-binding protein [Lichenifustis flavocetrariae]MCW6512935.1 ATP-binding protein [Lichenifustis flavocetrariae]